MDDRTESFESYEPESYEWDYEEAADRPPRVLWGRVIALMVLAGAAFWLGRSTAPVADASAELADAREELADAESQIEELQAQIAARAIEEPTPDATPDTESTPATTGEGRTYIVKSGDTLVALALRFYNDASLDELIAEANGIEDPEELRVGDERIIPPEP